jgi:hypothetical protein
MKDGFAHLESSGSARPKVLITDTNRWPVGPRLAIAFSGMGCQVAVLCPSPGHPIQKTTAVHRIFRYSGTDPVRSLRKAIEGFIPDIILPLCDRGVGHLHELYGMCSSQGREGILIADLIERSLGSPQSFPIVSSRYELLSIAHSEGIRIPEMLALRNPEDLRLWESEVSPPWVIKADGTWGGRGVRMAQNASVAERQFKELVERPNVLELAKRLLLNRDRGWILSDLRRRRRDLIAQEYIEGRPANCGVVCWQGKVLAGISVEVVQAQGPKEPATIVQVVEGGEMMEAAARLAKRLQLSGFFGLDYVIENRTADLYLIEMNPRSTPPCPLALGPGRDLVAALTAQLTGAEEGNRMAVTEKTRIAYFPQGWVGRGLVDTKLADATYYDIPVGESELIRELLHPWCARSLLGKVLDRTRNTLLRKDSLTSYVFEESTASVKTECGVEALSTQPRNIKLQPEP